MAGVLSGHFKKGSGFLDLNFTQIKIKLRFFVRIQENSQQQ